MTGTRGAASALLLLTALATQLHPQAGQTDVAQMGLRGRVRSVVERMAGYEERSGDWMHQIPVLTKRVDFNEAGYKTEERSYGGSGARSTYSYDRDGTLTAREDYGPGGLVSSWEMSCGPDGAVTSQIRYDSDGSISSKILRRFDASGEKLSEIHYDGKGLIIQRWERSLIDGGVLISHSPRWGGDETTRFDGRGRITEMRKGSGEAVRKWTYGYDAKGRLEQARYSDNQSASPETYTFLYDPKARLIEVDHSRNRGLPVSKRRYTYSTADRLIETVDWFDLEGVLDHTWIYSYDSGGNVLLKEYRHRLEAFSFRWEYRYDGSGRTTMETSYDSRGRVFRMTETIYNGRGNKILERVSGRGVDRGFRVIYEYDAAGRLLEEIRFDLDGRQQSRESSSYNELGDLVESASYNPDGSLTSSWKHLYVYDENGNWIERKTVETDNAIECYDVPTEIVFRTIRYFP